MVDGFLKSFQTCSSTWAGS